MQLRLLGQVILVTAIAALGGAGCRKHSTAAATTDAAAGPTVLTFYAPCGMEMPFMELEKLFEKTHPGVDVNLLLDNAHILTERVMDSGERPDLVASPGGHELARMLAAGLIKNADLHPFSQLDLCLFVPRANRAGVTTMADLTKDEVKVVAIADPEKTSIGHYSVEALKKAGIWDRIQAKVVITGDASQTYKHVASDKADGSFAYRSCPLKTAPDKIEYSKVRVIESVPAGLYGPAYATLAVMATTAHRALADEFIQLVFSEPGVQIMNKYDMPCLTQAAATKETP
jgi:molybdate transport system substrate-binding protein